VNKESQTSGSAATAIEMLSAACFQDELRRVTHFRPQSVSADPLAEAVKIIEQNPAFAQSRLLTRTLAALAHQQGEFRRAEIAAFDSKMLAIVLALMDAGAAGKYTREEWTQAVDATKAAQVGAGG
jgi:hypothetical protein